MARGIHPIPSTSAASLEISQVSSDRHMTMSSSAERTGLSLPLEQMAVPVYTATESRADVDQGGRTFFQNFIREEFQHEGIPEESLIGDRGPPPEWFNGDSASFSAMFRTPNSNFQATSNSNFQATSNSNFRATPSSVASTPDGYKNHYFRTVGASIREVADQFARSHERELIRNQAREVNLHHINKDLFWTVISEIFKEGFTKQRLVALFFFCSDVLIRSARESLKDLCTNLFKWSLEYIVENVCKWVYENGGWEKVFGEIWNVVYKVAVISALVVFIGVGVVYIRKNW